MLLGKSTSDMSVKGQLLDVQNPHVPVKRWGHDGVMMGKEGTWMTKEVVNLIKQKKEAHARFKRLESAKAFDEYKEGRRELKQMIRSAKRG